MADEKSTIIIKKKKGGHGGAHGGAWKIAYADFVTAMMAFFMVMWLLNTTEAPTRQAIASYFRRPSIFSENQGTTIMQGSPGILVDGLPPATFKGESEELGKVQAPPKSMEKSDEQKLAETITGKIKELKELISKMNELQEAGAQKDFGAKNLEEIAKMQEQRREQKEQLLKLQEMIKSEIELSPELKNLLGELDVKVDADGLNIEIMDTDKVSMFESGSATISPPAKAAFQKLADLIKPLSNTIDIIGHTDSKPYQSKDGSYTNWELSTDRANAARRLMEGQGIPASRFRNIVGRADMEPKIKDRPDAPSNRRITLKMRFNVLSREALAANSAMVEQLKGAEASWNSKIPEDQKVHSFSPIEVIRPKSKDSGEPVAGAKPSSVPISDKDSDDAEPNVIDNPLITPNDIFDY
jgi:chemotaxis protein MotB